MSRGWTSPDCPLPAPGLAASEATRDLSVTQFSNSILVRTHARTCMHTLTHKEDTSGYVRSHLK